VQPELTPADKEQAKRLWRRHVPVKFRRLIDAKEAKDAE
jgi:hypothetical protein